MNIGLILMAGQGTRLGSERPKQFLLIHKKPLFIYTVEKFAEHPEIDQIYIVAREEEFRLIDSHLLNWNISKIVKLINGGNSRQESVYNGLSYLQDIAQEDDLILIHDAARPLVSDKIISSNIEQARISGAAVTGLRSTNTIACSQDQIKLDSVPPREQLFVIQTPQTFTFDLILKAHQNAKKLGITHSSDDAQLVLKYGHEVRIAEGSTTNFKITTFEDLSMFKALLLLMEGKHSDGK